MEYLIPQEENMDNVSYSSPSLLQESQQGDYAAEPFEGTNYDVSDDQNMIPSSVAEKMKKLYADSYKFEKNVDTEFKQLVNQKTKMESHIQQLSSKLKESEDLRQQQRDGLMSTQMECENLTEKLRREEEQRSDIIKHIAELKVNFQSLEEHYSAVSDNCNRLEQHIAFVSMSMSSANSENAQLTEKNASLKNEVKSLQCTVERLNQDKYEMKHNCEKQMNHYEQILTQKDELLKKTEHALETALKESKKLAESNKTLQHMNSELNCKVKDQDNKLDSVMKSLELKKDELNSLSEAYQTVKEDLLIHLERNDQEQSQLTTIKEEKQAALKQLEEVTQQSAEEIEKWKKTVNDMLSEKENNIRETNKIIKMLEDAKAEQSNEIEKQSKKIDKLIKDLESSTEEVAKKDNWVKSMAKELETYKIECERKVKDAEEIYSAKIQELESVNKNLIKERTSTDTKHQNILTEKESAISALELSIKERDEAIVSVNTKLKEKTEAHLLETSSLQSEIDAKSKLVEEYKKKIADMKLFPTPSMFNYPRIKPTATPVTSNTSLEEPNIKGVNNNVQKMRLLKAQGLYESLSNDSMSDSSLECTPVFPRGYQSQTRMTHLSESVSRLRAIPKRKMKPLVTSESAPAKLDLEPSPGGSSKVPKVKTMWYDGPKGD